MFQDVKILIIQCKVAVFQFQLQNSFAVYPLESIHVFTIHTCKVVISINNKLEVKDAILSESTVN